MKTGCRFVDLKFNYRQKAFFHYFSPKNTAIGTLEKQENIKHLCDNVTKFNILYDKVKAKLLLFGALK